VKAQFFAEGIAAPQGSKRLVRPHGRTLMIDASRRLRPWRDAVSAAALAAGVPMLQGDVELHIVVRWVRPRSHLTARGTLRTGMPTRPRYADADKLARAICDALTGIAYRDDRQVASLSIERVWARDGDPSGAWIELREMID